MYSTAIIRFIIFFLLFTPIGASESNILRDAHVQVQLIPEMEVVSADAPFWIALHLKMDPGWHTYWKNPGDSGLATSVAWELPNGVQAGPIHWPYPSLIEIPPLTSYGYDDSVYLLIPFKISGALPHAEEFEIRAVVKWLSCKVNCIPGKAQLTLRLPVSSHASTTEEKSRLFSDIRSKLPFASFDESITAHPHPDHIQLRLYPTQIADPIRNMYFFPDRSDLVLHGAPQTITQEKDHYVLKVPLNPNALPGKSFEGVLYYEYGIDRPGSGKSVSLNLPFSRLKDAPEHPLSTGLVIFILFAFLGGVILNLMPCVLPVLSLKIFGFIQQAAIEPIKLRLNGIFYSMGILLSFWALFILWFVLRSLGWQIGWGFQLQSAHFNYILIVLLFIFALNLFGVFEIPFFSLRTNSSTRKSQNLEALFSGVLATILATPCTAPFMGVALGFALTQNALTSFLIFTSLGLGMSSPYFLLTLFPQLGKIFPKPGPWMLTLKIFLAFSLLATVIWLLWVISFQVQPGTLIRVLISLWIFAVALWLLGKDFSHRKKLKMMTRILITFILSLGIHTSWPHLKSTNTLPLNPNLHQNRERYSEDKLMQYIDRQIPVLIDFTAAWCLTCQVNERMVLQNDAVKEKITALGLKILRADWTQYDPDITMALSKYGRNSVPLYVLYLPHQTSPVILPEILTVKNLLAHLDQIEISSEKNETSMNPNSEIGIRVKSLSWLKSKAAGDFVT